MKRRFWFLLVTILAIASISVSSASARGSFRAGGKGGFHITSALGDITGSQSFPIQGEGVFTVSLRELEASNGFTVGAFFAYQISDLFLVQPEILYVAKGERNQSIDLGLSVPQTEISLPSLGLTWKGLDYIAIPVLLKLSLPTEAPVRPNFFAGPELAFNIGEKKLGVRIPEEWNDLAGALVSGEYELDADHLIKGFDPGVVFGAGVDVALGSVFIALEGRYTLGLISWTDIGDHLIVSHPDLNLEDVFLPIDKDDARNGGFSFMAGVGIPFGR